MRVERLEDFESKFVERAMVWCNVALIDTQRLVQSRLLHPIWDGSGGYTGNRSVPPPLGFDYGTLFASADDLAFGLIRIDPWRIKVRDAPASIRVWEQR